MINRRREEGKERQLNSSLLAQDDELIRRLARQRGTSLVGLIREAVRQLDEAGSRQPRREEAVHP